CTVRFSPPGRTPLSRVRAVEPGTTVTFDARHPLGVVRGGHRLTLPTHPEDGPPPDAGDPLGEVLREAVATTLPPDAPAAAFLSGGLDSSTIAALAARRDGGLDAFSVGYTGDVWQDETAHA